MTATRLDRERAITARILGRFRAWESLRDRRWVDGMKSDEGELNWRSSGRMTVWICRVRELWNACLACLLSSIQSARLYATKILTEVIAEAKNKLSSIHNHKERRRHITDVETRVNLFLRRIWSASSCMSFARPKFSYTFFSLSSSSFPPNHSIKQALIAIVPRRKERFQTRRYLTVCETVPKHVLLSYT